MNSIINYFKQSESESYDYLAFFRICIGSIAIFDLLSVFIDLDLFFSSDKTIIPQGLAYLYSDTFNYVHPIFESLKEWGLLEEFYTFAPWVYLLSLVFLITGFFPRFAAILSLLLQLIIFKSFEIYNNGYDHFLTFSLFYCVIFPVGKSFSIKTIFFKKNEDAGYRFNYRRALQIHLYIAYFFAGLPKFLTDEWWNGKSIWKAFFSIHSDHIVIPSFIFVALGIGTILLELFYPLLMNIKKTQKITLYLIISMHFGIAIFIKLYSFAAIMIALNLTAHYHLITIPSFLSKKKKIE
jgi:hypothetical protein